MTANNPTPCARPFEVVALGVGDTFSERHYPTAFLLEHEGVRLAIDCPDSYRRVLADASKRSGRTFDLAAIDHVLITHVHGDHMNGVEGVGFFSRFALDRRTSLVTTPDARAVIWDQRLRAPMEHLFDGTKFRELGFDDYFAYTALDWDAPIEVGPFRIRAFRTKHHVPTAALLVEAGGRVLGYSADTAFDPELVEVLSQADVVLHETNYGPAHTPYDALAGLPEALRAKMRLVHYPDQLDLEAAVIRPLEEGEIIAV